MYKYKKNLGISAYVINAIGVLIDLVFLALFSILLYPLLTHVRTAKIVINFTPIVKDFSPKLRKRRHFLIRRINMLRGKVSVIRWYFFLNEVRGPRTFNHLFDVINMPTQISHRGLPAGETFLVKEEQGIPFSTTKISST